jgi:hypothetical protein
MAAGEAVPWHTSSSKSHHMIAVQATNRDRDSSANMAEACDLI